MVDKLTRTYLLYVPPHLPAHHRYPLVIMYHFASGTARDMETTSGMSVVADRHGFLVVYPNGRGKTWVSGAADDATATDYDPTFHGARGNDDHFTAHLIDALSSRICIDPARVYAGGLSSGGSMAYRAACDLSARIAAVAPVDGTYTYSACHPSRPVSVIAFHGLANDAVPYDGGGPFHAPNVETWARAWARRDHCTRGPTGFSIPNYALARRYTSCKNGSEVEIYGMIAQGDSWPVLPPPHDGAELMWLFFASHPRA